MTAERGRLVCALAALTALTALGGCARDAYQVAWDLDWERALRTFHVGDAADALTLLEPLERRAPRPVDLAEVRLLRARTLRALGRDAAAAAELWDLAHEAPRRVDRARAVYGIARLAEGRGRLGHAVIIYRQLVLTYPDLMPGERALAHLQRIFAARGRRGVEAHLAWTHAVYPRVRGTTLGDNLVYHAASVAHRRFRATGDADSASAAERLYLAVHEDHRSGQLWNDGWWNLSLLYRRQGRVVDEIRAIERIIRTRREISLFGHDDHTYFWVGILRVARHQLLTLNAPTAAAESYQWFVETFPLSRWLDDVLFWQGCAWLRAGAPAKAERSFARIRDAWAESKYLARVPLARAQPAGDVCVPRDFVEGQW